MPRTHLAPQMSHSTFYVRWHRILYWNLLCLLGAGGGDPSPKVRAFCSSRWPDMRQSLSIDCLPTLDRPHPYSPKTKKQWQEMLRSRLQPIPCTIVILECSVGKGAPWKMVLVANLAPHRTHLAPEWAMQLLNVRWHRVLKWGRGGSQPKSLGFKFADRLLARTQQATPILPENKRKNHQFV